MEKIITLIIIVLLASCNTSKKLSKDSRLIDKSSSSTQESKQEDRIYSNSLIIDTTSNSEVEITITEITRTEQKDSSGVLIKESIKETKTNSKKQNKGLSLANNDSVDSKSNTINSNIKNDIKANDKIKESKELTTSTNWIYYLLIYLILQGIIIYWAYRFYKKF